MSVGSYFLKKKKFQCHICLHPFQIIDLSVSNDDKKSYLEATCAEYKYNNCKTYKV